MANNKEVQYLIEKLGDKKEDFLSKVRTDVEEYVSSQGSKCLSIIEKIPEKEKKIWHLEASQSYLKVLVPFCQEKKYNGHELDSFLTLPIIEIVSKRYQEYYQEHEAVIVSAIFSSLFTKKEFVQLLIDNIVKNRIKNSTLLQVALKKSSSHIFTSSVATKSSSIIINQLQRILKDNTVQILIKKTQAVIVHAVSIPIVKTIAFTIIKIFAKQIVVLIGKILASTAFKTIILAVIKKFILAIILSAIVKLIAAKLGIAAGGAWAIVLLPIIAGYIAYSIYTFPKTLGEKISSKLYIRLYSQEEIYLDRDKELITFVSISST